MLRNYVRAVAFTVLSAVAGGLQAQDLVFTLADFVPMWTNPSLTGAYSGTARVGGLYRDQSRGFNVDAFQTPTFYVDAPLIYVGKKKKSWLGVGGMVISDTKGAASLSDTYLEGGVALHRIFNERRKSRSVFSVGLRGGVLQRAADLENRALVLAEEQDIGLGGGGLGVGSGLDRQLDPNASGVDIALGVSLARTIDEDRNFRIGLTAQHLTVPDVALTRQEYTRSLTYGAQAQYRQLIGDQYLFEPAMFAQFTSSVATAQVQASLGTYLGIEKDKLLKVGLGFRAPRQAYTLVGFEVGDLKIAAAFDIYTGGPQSVTQGFANNPDAPVNSKLFNSAFELGLAYIIKIYKEPKVSPVILCPQI